jgi:uncharacterized protein YdbL (DUF1318 family)
MNYARNIKLAMLLMITAGCITVNVYFPAAAAEQAADRIIKEIYGDKVEEMQRNDPANQDEEQQPENGTDRRGGAAIDVLDFLVAAARAQEADIDISSPAINRLKSTMTQRHTQLESFYANGAVGMDSRGLVTLRDPAAVPIRDRNTVNQLVAGENQDRNALYAEIARANGHPEWESQIRATFARRWVANAPAGWYFQDAGGNWQRK